MKEILLKRAEHNGMRCYKDETKVFMVRKEYGTRTWVVCYAKSYEENNNNDIINECGAWGYKHFSQVNTLEEAKHEIEYLMTRPLFNEYQTELLKKTYGLEVE